MMSDINSPLRPILLPAALLAALTLAACDSQRGDAPPEPEPTVTPSAQPSQSIIREGFDEPEPIVPLETLEGTIGFPEGGAKLDDAARAELQQIIGSDQFAEGWPIVLRAHSDAGGTDAANMRASQARGDAVAEWLMEKGVSEDRITVIAFGEQNPAEPNARPDGTPNEAGRAANRRVDVTLADPDPEPEDETTSFFGEAADDESESAAKAR